MDGRDGQRGARATGTAGGVSGGGAAGGDAAGLLPPRPAGVRLLLRHAAPRVPPGYTCQADGLCHNDQSQGTLHSYSGRRRGCRRRGLGTGTRARKYWQNGNELIETV